ncbi:MAG: thioredoxin domain-containing protein [Candidatus Magasanikbacteria bacterium]|nr:thioredoxin domain-containing protein [Candidatus Magasanikbacteria bacterium]MCA9389006.1 thioredoxin domain-containing protein [Candidatus Magasanikbacteria bacterium]
MQETTNKGLIVGTIVAVVAIFGALTWALISLPSDGPGQVAGSLTFDNTNAPIKGNADAALEVQIYSDLQCPACKASEPGLKYAMDKYGDRVKFVWNDFPLMSIHPNARNAANAARCANDQGKFWEYTDQLFNNQSAWQGLSKLDEAFTAYAVAIGLNAESFSQCFADKTFDSIVMNDVAEGNRNAIRATPTFVVGGKVYNGLGAQDWDRILTAALAQ